MIYPTPKYPALEFLLMYMFLPFLTAFIGLILVWFEKRLAGLTLLAVTVAILMVWFRFHANSHLHISL